MKVLITGSSGLIGSELVTFFDTRATRVVGIDNNMRADFFGVQGDTRWNLQRLAESTKNFSHFDVDIRNRTALARIFAAEGPFDLIVHCAAQPSHDLAAKRAWDDFDVNAVGTVNMLETTRKMSKDSVFVLLSTNKVYGDAPNEIPMAELPTRWEYSRPEDWDGVTEHMRLDHCKHSIFGASKVAADIMTQEYGRYFGMRTVALRGGCLTGPNHSGVELHGFLSYLVKTNLTGGTYRVFGYKGKQVRDNIHSLDVARAIEAIYQNPRCGEVYNIGGGRNNSCSILEAFSRVEELTGKKMRHEYVDQNREGDHICYISNLAKLKAHYPSWDISKSLDDIFREIVDAWKVRPTTVQTQTFKNVVATPETKMIQTLATREQYRDGYWTHKDPIANDRLLWRAQTFRHLAHLLPGQTILELGCGEGRLTTQIIKATRGENPITAVTFSKSEKPANFPEQAERVVATNFPTELSGRRFDFVFAMDLLDGDIAPWTLQQIYDHLAPGGQVIFYESNPWNPMLKLKRGLKRLIGRKDPRVLLSRTELYELISEIGYVRSFSVFNDFCFNPLTKGMMWMLRNASILLENAPLFKTLAGSILVHAQKPPKVVEKPPVSLAEHESLKGAISVVIPCHNEEMNIAPLITRLRELYGDYLHEIIPVDDNSKDKTAEVIRNLAAQDKRIKPVYRKPPNGVGRALTDGYKAATGKYVLSMDCDFQHLLPEVRDLFDAANEGYDVVVGSRFNRHSVLLNYPFQKIVANRAFHLIARVILWRSFRDLTNNLKLIRRDVLEKLDLQQPHFAVNAETGFQPLVMGAKIKEVPISWINRTPDMGTSSFKLVKVGGGYWRVLWNLFLRRFNKGPYKDLPTIGDETKTVRDMGKPSAPAQKKRLAA